MNTVPRSVKKLFPNVTKLRESKLPLDVDVVAGDVKGARQKEGDRCAMARAVCRQTQADGAVIGMSYSFLINGNTATKYMTSPSIAREIVSFDRSSKFAPGEYRLSAVPPSHTQRAYKKRQAEQKRAKRAKAKANGTPIKGGAIKQPRRIVHKETVDVRSFRRKAA